MKLTKEFYENLTIDKLEEHVEFVEWALVPKAMINAELKEKFYCILKLQARIWFEGILEKTTLRKFDKEYPDVIFLYLNNKYGMYYDMSSRQLDCTYTSIIGFISKEFNLHDIELYHFIKNMVEQHLKTIEIPSEFYENREKHFVERSIRNINIKTIGSLKTIPA